MTFSNISDEIDAYAAYINAPRHRFDDDDDHDELKMLDEDTAKARLAMENAWHEHRPTLPEEP
jgi:hypothetical protein